MIICYTVLEIQCVTDVIIFYFGPFFALLNPLSSQKIKILKNWKKQMGTTVPKIMIICYPVLEIWHLTDVSAIFHFGLFFPFYLPNSPKNQTFQKNEKSTWRYHHFTIVYQKDMAHDKYNYFSFWAIFCPLTPLTAQKINILKKNEKKRWRYYHFTQVYQKWQSHDVWFLRYWVWGM